MDIFKNAFAEHPDRKVSIWSIVFGDTLGDRLIVEAAEKTASPPPLQDQAELKVNLRCSALSKCKPLGGTAS